MMMRERERFPYWWCVAASAALAVALTPWVPMTPFSGVIPLWQRWIGVPITGGICVVEQFDGFLTLFVPFLGSLTLSLPLLALRLYLGEKTRLADAAAKTIPLLLLLLAGLNVASDVVSTSAENIGWEIGRVVLTVGIGAAFVAYGVGLRRTGSRNLLTRTMIRAFIGAGVCLSSFVLLPVGGVALIVAYCLLTVVLARRRV